MGDWDPPDAFDPRQDKCFHNLQILFWWYVVTLVLFILLLKLFYTRFFSNLIVWASNLLELRLLYVINENNTKTTLSPAYRFLVFRFLLAYVFYRFFQSKYEWKPVLSKYLSERMWYVLKYLPAFSWASLGLGVTQAPRGSGQIVVRVRFHSNWIVVFKGPFCVILLSFLQEFRNGSLYFVAWKHVIQYKLIG